MKNKRNLGLWIAYGVLMIATILAFIFSPQIYGVNKGLAADGKTIIWDPRSVFDVTVSNNAFLQYMYSHAIPNTIHTIQIIGVAVTLAIVLHYLARITFHTKKGLTISKLIVNFLKWAIAIASVFFIMNAWGANATMMLASAGVVTLIIGLGSQALIADILAGIFMVFEGDFQVSDIVIIDGWRGEVVSIGIRTTKLIDAGGNIKIVNNSQIKTLINQTKELSVAKSTIAISYNAKLPEVEEVINKNLERMKADIPAIVEGPFYRGVSELGESSVNLLFIAKCKEDNVYQVQRDLNREIKIIFDENNIEIPFNQIVVHHED
ncbi:MAG: mechanosensitive ion channel family protein [Bacilli bacterium]|nr:mechanosensitive ion channel family protein [Bacilli bacterium]